MRRAVSLESFKIELAFMHRNTLYVILVEVIGTLKYFGDCSSGS